eukprot:scaffold18208_cov182-Amphora_coffeaeformis.AAC.1
MTTATEDSDTNTSTNNGSSKSSNRILVIGSTGAGKSTLINALVGDDLCHTSSAAVGCTGSYTTVTATHNDVTYEFIDTVGINEPEEGTVSRTDALKMFFKFLRDNADGFNLIIFCTREGRITEESKTTYEVMVKKLYASSESKQSPPVLIFVGGMFLEYDEDPQQWCEANRATFVQQGLVEAAAELDAFHAIALPRSKNPMLAKVFQQISAASTKRAWNVIERTLAPEPVRLYTSVRGMLNVVQNVWNTIAANFGWPLIIPDVLREIAAACGFSSKEISELTHTEPFMIAMN